MAEGNNRQQELASLKGFVTAYLRSTGAAVEEVGYELIDVLLPDHLAELLGSQVLRFAFDYEVAQVNPDSVFLTYGSALLDRIIHAARNTGLFVEFFWPGAKIKLPACSRTLPVTFNLTSASHLRSSTGSCTSIFITVSVVNSQ